MWYFLIAVAVCVIIFKVAHLFRKKIKEEVETQERIEKTTEVFVNNYQNLIDEYELIKQKKSKLSRKKRDVVVHKINEAIKMGHIDAELEEN